jgi:hypothetical protein
VLTAYVLTIFEETSEQGSYVAPERINAIAMLPLGGAGQWYIALACQDRVIRLLNHTKVVQV